MLSMVLLLAVLKDIHRLLFCQLVVHELQQTPTDKSLAKRACQQ